MIGYGEFDANNLKNIQNQKTRLSAAWFFITYFAKQLAY